MNVDRESCAVGGHIEGAALAPRLRCLARLRGRRRTLQDAVVTAGKEDLASMASTTAPTSHIVPCPFPSPAACRVSAFPTACVISACENQAVEDMNTFSYVQCVVPLWTSNIKNINVTDIIHDSSANSLSLLHSPHLPHPWPPSASILASVDTEAGGVNHKFMMRMSSEDDDSDEDYPSSSTASSSTNTQTTAVSSDSEAESTRVAIGCGNHATPAFYPRPADTKYNA